MRTLADDRNIVIKKADKGSCVVIWDRYDYIVEEEVSIKMNKFIKKFLLNRMLGALATKSSGFFKDLRRRRCVTSISVTNIKRSPT